MQMGDINAHINCNETDFIINDSDNVLDSFLPNNYIGDSMPKFEEHSNPTNNE